MFEKYDIEELYLASINVIYPDYMGIETNIGGILIEKEAGYGYFTVVRAIEHDDHTSYIDLANPERPIRNSRNSSSTSYILEDTEPLSNYYTQDGKRKQTFSKRRALKEGEKHYNEFHQKRLALTKEN